MIRGKKLIDTNQILHCRTAGLVDPFHKLEHMMGIAVYHRDPNIIVVLVLNMARREKSDLIQARPSGDSQNTSSRPIPKIPSKGY